MSVVGLRDSLAYLVHGPGYGKRAGARTSSPAQIILFPIDRPATRSSWAYDAHVVSEAAVPGRSTGSKAPQTLSLAWDERDAWGLDLASRSWQGLTPTERKSILLDIYINNPWVSACIDVIVKRVFSGGFTIEKIDEEAKDNQAHYDQLMEFCLRVNDDWDFNQYGRASLTSEMIYGECYTEIVWKAGLPFELYNVDCLTMGYKPNRYGQIDQYYQEMPSTLMRNTLDPRNIIRWWFPHPRASIDPFAPAEKVSDAVLIDKKMINWMTTFFQKGARFQYYIKGLAGENEADRFMAWFDQNISGEKNAHRPPATWGNAEFAPLGNAGALEMDFQKGLDRMRTIVFAAFGVPPAAVSIIESGNIGGGTGEDQDKSLIFNACDPVKQQFLEKLNYRIVQQGFHIDDYRIGLRYADYRSDESVAKVQDMRIRNGSRTVDEMRQEDGKRPYAKGGSVPIIITTKEVTPLPRVDDLEDEQRQSAQLDLQTKQATVEKLKQPPQPPALLPGQSGQQQAQKQPQKPDQQDGNKSAHTIAGKRTQPKEEAEAESDLLDDTLKMPAIRLPKKTRQQESSDQQLVPNIWQPPDIHARLALLRQHGVASKEWVGDASMCDAICAPNHGHVVAVEAQFPSSHADVPGHPHCGCRCIYRDKDGNVVEVPDSYGSDYQ